MSVTTSQLLHVPLDQLAPDPLQPRTEMPTDALRELAESLKRHGVIEPLVATEQVDAGESAPRYLILAGERRWRAAQLAGLATVPVVLREPPKDATERLVLQIAENDVREDLSLLDRARAVERALQESGLSKKEFAERLGRSLPWLSNLLAVMAAAGSTLEALEHGLIRHGETVRQFQKLDEKERRRLLREAQERDTPITMARVRKHLGRQAALKLKRASVAEATESAGDAAGLGREGMDSSAEAPSTFVALVELSDVPLGETSPAGFRLLLRLLGDRGAEARALTADTAPALLDDLHRRISRHLALRTHAIEALSTDSSSTSLH